MRSTGLKPSIITYSTLISRAATWKKVVEAERYFAMMHEDGITPDVQAFNSLMNAYAKVGDSGMYHNNRHNYTQ
jgi:pentatricopeptide repeat protein